MDQHKSSCAEGDTSSQKEAETKSFLKEMTSAVLSRTVRQVTASIKGLEHFSQTSDLRYLLAAQRPQTTVQNEDGDRYFFLLHEFSFAAQLDFILKLSFGLRRGDFIQNH